MVPSSDRSVGLLEIVSCADWADFKSRWRATLTAHVSSDRLFGRYIFRGQSCATWKLETAFDRKFANLKGKPRQTRYDQMLRLFAKNLSAFADRDASILLGKRLPEDEDAGHSELEVLAQHHGLPTRILDWSLSIYVAAFFAFSKPDECRSGLVSVWALNAETVKAEISDEQLEILDDFYSRNSRQLWQLGVFIRNRTSTTNLVDIFENPTDFVSAAAVSGVPMLTRFDIPLSSHDIAKDDLEMMRINSISLFPGIEGVVRWIEHGAV